MADPNRIGPDPEITALRERCQRLLRHVHDLARARRSGLAPSTVARRAQHLREQAATTEAQLDQSEQ